MCACEDVRAYSVIQRSYGTCCVRVHGAYQYFCNAWGPGFSRRGLGWVGMGWVGLAFDGVIYATPSSVLPTIQYSSQFWAVVVKQHSACNQLSLTTLYVFNAMSPSLPPSLFSVVILRLAIYRKALL